MLYDPFASPPRCRAAGIKNVFLSRSARAPNGRRKRHPSDATATLSCAAKTAVSSAIQLLVMIPGRDSVRRFAFPCDPRPGEPVGHLLTTLAGALLQRVCGVAASIAAAAATARICGISAAIAGSPPPPG